MLFDACVRLFAFRVILRIFDAELPLGAEPVEPDPEAESVEFPTHDGLTLRGSLHRGEVQPTRGLVVFCPELNGSHSSAAAYCAGLLRDGFDVLAFDFRNQGQSDSLPGYRPLHWLTEHETADVEAALRYVASRDDLRALPLGMAGVSRGGAAALAIAARHPEVRAVAVEGAFSTAALNRYFAIRWSSMYLPAWIMKIVPAWHLNSTLKMSRWISQFRRKCRYTNLERLLPELRNRPVLLIAGRRDSYVPLEVPEELARCIGGERCELWKVPHARHNGARNVAPQTYDDRLADFFARALLAEPRPARGEGKPERAAGRPARAAASR